MDSRVKFDHQDGHKVINADNKKKRKHERKEGINEEIREEEFVERQTLEERNHEQETFEQCYEDIKNRLNVRSSDDEIRATIMGWYLDKNASLPRPYLMNSMVRTYIHWLNDEAGDDERMTDLQLFQRLYPDLKFV